MLWWKYNYRVLDVKLRPGIWRHTHTPGLSLHKRTIYVQSYLKYVAAIYLFISHLVKFVNVLRLCFYQSYYMIYIIALLVVIIPSNITAPYHNMHSTFRIKHGSTIYGFNYLNYLKFIEIISRCGLIERLIVFRLHAYTCLPR